MHNNDAAMNFFYYVFPVRTMSNYDFIMGSME